MLGALLGAFLLCQTATNNEAVLLSSDDVEGRLQACLNSHALVQIPPGSYTFSQPLVISQRTTRLEVVGAGGHGRVEAQLLFRDCDGLIIEDSGQGSTVQGVGVNGIRRDNPDTAGFVIRCRCHVEYCRARNFGVGFKLSSLGGANLNNWYLANCVAANNLLDGFYVDGGDANAGTSIHCDARNNGRWGLYDSSFLGNTWIGFHTNNNGDGEQGGAVLVDNRNARSVFIGLYCEKNQRGVFGHPRSTIIPGAIEVPVEGMTVLGRETTQAILREPIFRPDVDGRNEIPFRWEDRTGIDSFQVRVLNGWHRLRNRGSAYQEVFAIPGNGAGAEHPNVLHVKGIVIDGHYIDGEALEKLFSRN